MQLPRAALALLLLLVLVADSTTAQPQAPSPPRSIYDDDDEPDDELTKMRDKAHMARYVMMSKLTFSNEREARAAMSALRAGHKTFMDLSQERQRKITREGRGDDRDAQSGDLGLITEDMVEPEIAKYAFDIRQPIAETAKDIIGPICTAKGCSVIAVFFRYRKSYFSDAWYEAEAFAKKSDMKFSDFLQRLEQGDGMKEIAFLVWPWEHISVKKIKIQQLRNDVKRIGKVDPSTVNSKPKPNRDLSAHRKLMAERDQLFKRVSPDVIAAHPEIFAMSIDQIIAKGWVQPVTTAGASRTDDGLDAKPIAEVAAAAADDEGPSCGSNQGGEGCSDLVRGVRDTPPPVVDGDDVDPEVKAALNEDDAEF